MKTVTVDEQQLNELLRQNAEMKADIGILISAIDFFRPLFEKVNLSGTEKIGFTGIMFKLTPVLKSVFENRNNILIQNQVNDLKTLFEKYGQVQQLSEQNKKLTTGTDTELTKH